MEGQAGDSPCGAARVPSSGGDSPRWHHALAGGGGAGALNPRVGLPYQCLSWEVGGDDRLRLGTLLGGKLG